MSGTPKTLLKQLLWACGWELRRSCHANAELQVQAAYGPA
jgi:hypothetical protein